MRYFNNKPYFLYSLHLLMSCLPSCWMFLKTLSLSFSSLLLISVVDMSFFDIMSLCLNNSSFIDCSSIDDYFSSDCIFFDSIIELTASLLEFANKLSTFKVCAIYSSIFTFNFALRPLLSLSVTIYARSCSKTSSLRLVFLKKSFFVTTSDFSFSILSSISLQLEFSAFWDSASLNSSLYILFTCLSYVEL